ncbi:hypothetical protein [Sulfurisphaera ohwakuensis]|uniref:hypothetical protein n=1 Tax=Sulfurisphaera ohwakuensis TaxID=69656 RepID=UPI0036F29601
MEKLKFGINYPMTLLLGIRRSGNSSLVKDLILELEKVITISFPERLKKLFTGVRGVDFAGIGLKFKWRRERKINFSIPGKPSEIAEKKKQRVCVIFDEMQELRKLKGYNILYTLAYAYDNLDVRFV